MITATTVLPPTAELLLPQEPLSAVWTVDWLTRDPSGCSVYQAGAVRAQGHGSTKKQSLAKAGASEYLEVC